MDIEGILASVDNSPASQVVQDFQELTRAWVTERGSPEVLPWPSEIMDRVLARIRQQVCTIDPMLYQLCHDQGH